MGEELIRQTLAASSRNSHYRCSYSASCVICLAMLSSAKCGSCFATAPAEIIHDEQPELFLQDLLDLIATGTLKRTFGGIENSVPLSASWGSGDLKKPLFIRISS